jgi:hypothetical protein
MASAQAGPFVCMTRDFAKRIAYVSPIFRAEQADQAKMNTAWHQVMTTQYGITALPYQSCQGAYPSDRNADSMRTQFISFIEDKMKQKVVQLDWTWNGAKAITVVAQAPPPPPPPPPPAVLTDADRKAAEAEMAQSKAYCEQNYKGVFDCDCFARAVLHHRLSHPDEWVGDKGSTSKSRPPVHDLAVGVTYQLDCSECLDDQRLSAWARNTVSGELSQQVMTKLITQAKADAYADCVAKAFPAKWHASPMLHKELPAMNEARLSCGNPRG